MKVRLILYTSSLNGDRAVRAVERAGCLSGTEDISCVTKGEGRLAIVGNMADKDEEAPRRRKDWSRRGSSSSAENRQGRADSVHKTVGRLF